MNGYIAQYIALINGVKLITLFGLIALDVLLGVILAIRSKTFDFKRLSDFLDTSMLSMVAGYFLVGIFGVLEPTYAFAVTGTWAIINATLIAEVVAKLKKFGIPVEK